MADRKFRQIGARVPEFVHKKAEDLLREIRTLDAPMARPRATKDDLVGALIEAADVASAAGALATYDPLLGAEINKIEAAAHGTQMTPETS